MMRRMPRRHGPRRNTPEHHPGWTHVCVTERRPCVRSPDPPVVGLVCDTHTYMNYERVAYTKLSETTTIVSFFCYYGRRI